MSSVQAHSTSSALELSNIPTTQSNFVSALNETEDTVQKLECKLTSRNCTAQPIIVQVEHIIRNKPKSSTEKPQFGATLSSIRSKKCKSPKTNELSHDQEHKTIAAIIDLSSKDEEISKETLKNPSTNLEETAHFLENTINDPRLFSGADPQFQSSSIDSSIDDVAQALAKTPWRPHPMEDSQTEYEITCCGWKKVKKPQQKSASSNGPWAFRPPGLNNINYPEKVLDQTSVDSNWPPELPENRINQADCFCIDHNEHCDDWVKDCLVSPAKNSTSEECYCHGPKMNIPLPIYEPEVEVLSAEYEEYVENSTKESKSKSKEKEDLASCLMQDESLSLPKPQLTQDPIQKQSSYHDHCEPLIESQQFCEPLYQESYQESYQEPYQEPYQESYQEHQAGIRENSQKSKDCVQYQHLCEPLNVPNQGDSFSTHYNNYEKLMPFTSSVLTPEGDSFSLKPESKPETRHETSFPDSNWQSSHKSLEIPLPAPALKRHESQIVFEENRELFSEYASGENSFNIYSDEALSSKLAEKMIKKLHPPSPPTGRTEYYNKTSFNVYSEEALNSKLSEKVHKKKPTPSPPVGRKEFSNESTVQSKTKTSATQSENESMTNQSTTSPHLKVVFSPDENWKKIPKLISPTVAEGSDEFEHKPKMNYLKNEQASPSSWMVENDENESLRASPSITLPPTPEKRGSPEMGEIHESPMSEYMTPSPKFRTVKSINSPDSQHHRSLSKGSQEFFESQRYPTPMELQNAPCMSVPEVQFDMKKVPECPPEVPKCVDKVPRCMDVAGCFQEVPRCYDIPTCPESSSCHKMWTYDRDSNNSLSGVPSCHCLAPDADDLFDAKKLRLMKKRKCDKPPSEPLPEVKKLCSPSGHVNKSQPSVHLEPTITEDKIPLLCQELKTKNNQSLYICESADDESNLQTSLMKQNQHYQQRPQFQPNLHFPQNPFELLKQPYNYPDNQNFHQNSMTFPENQNMFNNALIGSPSQLLNTMERMSPCTRVGRENKQRKRLNPWLYNENAPNLKSFKNGHVSREWVQPQFELNQQPVNSLIHACDFVHPEDLNFLPTSPCQLVSHQPSTPPVTLQKPFCHAVDNQHSLLRQPSVCDLVLTKPIQTSSCRKKYFHNCRQQQSPQCYGPEVCQETPNQDSFHNNYESKCDSSLKKSKSRMSCLQPASKKKQSKSSGIFTKKVRSVQRQEKELCLEEEYAEHLNIIPDLAQKSKNIFISPKLYRHHSSSSLVDESHPGMCMTPRRHKKKENNNQIPKLEKFHSRGINWDWHPQAVVTCTSKVKPSLKISRSTVTSYTPVNLKPSEKPMTQSLKRYADEPKLSQSSVRSYSFINQKPTEQPLTQHNFEIYSEEPKKYKSKKYHECSTTCNAEQCIPSSRFQGPATHQECTMPFSAMPYPAKPFNAIRHYTSGPVSHTQCPSNPGSNVQCPSSSGSNVQCPTNLVSHVQCPTNLVSHMECPSSSIPLVQDPLIPVPEMHCLSSPVSQMQCPTSPVSHVQCPSSPVPHVQCSSNLVTYEQCPSIAASSPAPCMQNQPSPGPYMKSSTMINLEQQVPVKCVENLPLSNRQQQTPRAYAIINTELNLPTMQQNIAQPSKEKQNVPTTQLVNAGVQYSLSSNAILETHNNRLTRPLLPNTAGTQQQSLLQKQPKGKVTTIPQVTSESKLSINQHQCYESKTKIYQNQQTQTFETMEDPVQLILDSHYQLPKQSLSPYPRNRTVATETSECDLSFRSNNTKKLLEESRSKNVTLISPASNKQTNPSQPKTCHCHCRKSSIKIEPCSSPEGKNNKACRKMSRQEVLPCCSSDTIKPKKKRCKSNRYAIVSSDSETQHQYNWTPMIRSQPTEEQLNVVKNPQLIHVHHYSMPRSADTESKNHKKRRRHHIHKNCSYVANSSTMSLPTANTQPRDTRCWYCRQPFNSPNSMPFRNENAMSAAMPLPAQPFGNVNTMSQPNYFRVAYVPIPCLPQNPQMVPRLMPNYPTYPYQYQYQMYDDYPLGEAATVSSSGSTKSSRDTQSSRQHVCVPKEYRNQNQYQQHQVETCSCHSDRESDYSDPDSGCVTPTPCDPKFPPESQDKCHCTQLSHVEGVPEEQDDEHEEVIYYDTIEPAIEKITEEENVGEPKRYCSLSKLHDSNDEVEESVEQIANPEQKLHSCRCSVEGNLNQPMNSQRPMFSPLSPPLAHPVSTSQSLPTEFDQILKGQKAIRFKKSPRCNKSPVMDSGSGRAAMETTNSHLQAISSVSEPLINGSQLTQDAHNSPTWSKKRSHYHRCVDAKNVNQFTAVSPSKIPEEKAMCYNGCNAPKSPRLKYACSVLAFNTSPTSQGDPSSVECRQVSPDLDRPTSTKRWTTPTDVNIVEVVDDDETQGEN